MLCQANCSCRGKFCDVILKARVISGYDEIGRGAVSIIGAQIQSRGEHGPISFTRLGLNRGGILHIHSSLGSQHGHWLPQSSLRILVFQTLWRRKLPLQPSSHNPFGASLPTFRRPLDPELSTGPPHHIRSPI